MVVFVLDRKKRPLMPCSEKRARLLLERGRAVIHCMSPFTVRLKDRLLEESQLQPLRLKIDPGARISGLAVLRQDNKIADGSVLAWAGEIHHGTDIKDLLDKRRNVRRSRRGRKTRYRQPRFNNRKRVKGWLPPSLVARAQQTMNAIHKLGQLLPVTALTVEHLKFDTQLLHNPDIQGIEYQQGELAGYEVKEYLLEKYRRKCAYCNDQSGDIRLEVEHVVPKNPLAGSKGTDRISNLVIACRSCNTDKGNLQPDEWLIRLKQSKRKLDKTRARQLPLAMASLKKPLEEPAFLNATRWKLLEQLKKTSLPVECGTGARTKMQRLQHGLPKTHYYDAACTGTSTPAAGQLKVTTRYVAIWKSTGRGKRQMCRTNKHGFPVTHRPRQKLFNGFQTGDLITASVPRGKYKGKWRGRVAVRSSGYFDIKGTDNKRICQGISFKHCRLIQRANGWHHDQKRIESVYI
ncbi:MAG: RNA-guided endonuclease IscB [Candidatus Odinarchaeota archaeon]